MLVAFMKDIAMILAAISSIWVGFNGLKTWKLQLQGNTEYVLAKGVLTTLYELREAIDLARSGYIIYYPDLPTEEWNKLNEKEKNWLSILGKHRNRWDTITLAYAKFKTSLIEVEVIWGRDIIAKTKPITSLINELLQSMNESITDELNHTFNPESHSGDDRIKINNRKKIIYKSFDEEDEYMKKLNKAISDIENYIKPHISVITAHLGP